MEDKLTKKKEQEISATKSDAIAGALSSLYKKALNEEDLQTQREEASYYRKLARPRSVKYLELVSEEMRITERLGALYRQLEEHNAATAAAGDKPRVPIASDGDKPQAPTAWEQADAKKLQQTETQQSESPEWWQEDVKPLHTEETIQKEEAPLKEGTTSSIVEEAIQTQIEEQTTTPEWWQTDVQKMQQEETVDNSAILAEIAQLKAELADVRAALEVEMPVGHGRLGMIYCLDKEGKLIDLGAIAGPGTPFGSVEELLNMTKPQTEQEKRQWIKGNDAYWSVNGDCLVVEIYLTAICVVFDDGSVKCYRD